MNWLISFPKLTLNFVDDYEFLRFLSIFSLVLVLVRYSYPLYLKKRHTLYLKLLRQDRLLKNIDEKNKNKKNQALFSLTPIWSLLKSDERLLSLKSHFQRHLKIYIVWTSSEDKKSLKISQQMENLYSIKV